MKVLFDHNTPRRRRRYLPTHHVTTTQQQGWERLSNGALLRAAADGGFDVLLTLAKRMEYEQNLDALPIPIILMGMRPTALTDLIPHVPTVLTLLAGPLTPALYVVMADGSVVRLTAPRPKP